MSKHRQRVYTNCMTFVVFRYKSSQCPDRDASHKERRSSSGCKKRKKRRRHDESDDETPPVRRHHSSSSDTESEISRGDRRSSSVESKSPVSRDTRAEGEIVPGTHERRNLGNKARPPSADTGRDGRARLRHESGVMSQGYRGHRSPVDENSSFGRRNSVESKRRHEDIDLDGSCTKDEESHGRRSSRHRTHSRDSVTDRGQPRRQVPERKPQSTERQHKQAGFGSAAKSRASRGQSTRRSSEEQNHRSAVTKTTDTGKDCAGDITTSGKGSRRESLDDMEDFLKMLKEKKKQQMGGGKGTT